MEYRFDDNYLDEIGNLFIDYLQPKYKMTFYNYLCFVESSNQLKESKTSIHSVKIK